MGMSDIVNALSTVLFAAQTHTDSKNNFYSKNLEQNVSPLRAVLLRDSLTALP